MILRVKKVLVGDSDFAFVHAIGSDGAEFKMELPINLGRALKHDALIQVDVRPVSVPEQLDAMNAVEAANAVSSAATSTLGQRSNARTSGINHHRSVSGEISDKAEGESPAGTATRAVTSAGSGALGKRRVRRMASPDPRGAKPKIDPLRSLLGL